MTFPELLDLARFELHNHKLDTRGWSIGEHNRKRSLGTCNFRSKKISFSRFLLGREDAPEEQQVDTILHEIAHALDYEERGTSDHGPRWKAIARRIGAEPTRCGDSGLSFEQKRYKYEVACSEGCWTAGRYRKTKKLRRMMQENSPIECADCGASIRVTQLR